MLAPAFIARPGVCRRNARQRARGLPTCNIASGRLAGWSLGNRERILSMNGLVLLGGLFALAFRVYLSPAMLLEFSNLMLYG